MLDMVNLPRWIDPRVNVHSLNIEQIDRRLNFMLVLRAKRNANEISHDTYDEMVDLLLG